MADVFTIDWPQEFVAVADFLKKLNADMMDILGNMTCQVQVRNFAEAFRWHMAVLPALAILCGLAYGVVARQRKSLHSKAAGDTPTG